MMRFVSKSIIKSLSRSRNYVVIAWVSIMKAWLVLAIFFVAVLALGDSKEFNSFHSIQKRQIIKPVTIMVKPPPGCVFYECIASCKQRGYRNGGYCTINGCQCLR